MMTRKGEELDMWWGNADFIGNRRVFLISAYIVSAFLLVFSSSLFNRGYQDSWILEGVWPQTLLFTLVFAVLVVNIKSNKQLVVLIASFIMILSAVPNLKYLQLYGAFDSISHYGYASRIIELGHVPTIGAYSKEYSGTPGLHIFLASLSQITGISMNDSVKILLVLLSVLIIFVTYYAANKMLSESNLRFVLYGLIFTLPVFISLFGTSYALPLIFIFIATLLKQFTSYSSSKYNYILLLSGSALIISHGVSSIFLAVLLCSIFVLMRTRSYVFPGLKIDVSLYRRYFNYAVIVTLAVLVWWFISAPYLIRALIVNIINAIFNERSTEVIPGKFFEITPFNQLTFLILRFYDMILVGGLSLFGIFLYYKRLRSYFSDNAKIIFEQIMYITLIIGLITIPSAFILRSYTLERFYVYFKILSPFLIGIGLIGLYRYTEERIEKLSTRRFLFSLFFFIILVPSLLTTYTYQPIIPTNNRNEYIVDYRSVNTNYQVSMITFADQHYAPNSRVGSDSVTSWQIRGLASTPFFLTYTYTNPLNEDYYKVTMVLMHYSGLSGTLNEKIDYRTRYKVDDLKLKLGTNIVYDNSESFILLP